MSNDFNQCIFTGRLAKTPELKYAKSGMAICNFTVACNHKRGEEEHVEWVKVVSFDKQAEAITKYLDKGSSVLVSGRLQTRSWDADDGKKYMTEIIASQVQFLGAKDDIPKEEVEPAVDEKVEEDIEEEDLPF